MRAFRADFATRKLALVLCETIVIAGAVALAAWLRLGDEVWVLFREEGGVLKAFFIAGICQVCLYYADLYDLKSVSDARDLFIRIVQALGAASFLLALFYFWFPSLMIGRGVFVIAAMIVITLVVGWRHLFEWISRQMAPHERLLIVGTAGAALELARELYERRHELGVDIVGFVDPDPAKIGTPMINPGVIGTVDDIPEIVRSRKVDRVVVSLTDARGKLPMDKLLEMKLEGVQFDHLASAYEQYTGKIAVENLRPSWLIFSAGFRKTAWLTASKRALDVVAAGVLLVMTLPLMGLIALVLKATSKGPLLYHQPRVGLHGHVFNVHKFRSMRPDAEAGTGAVWAKPGDQRVTSVGKFLRRTRLDELPQVLNILRGDMSFVGPRPERPEFIRQLSAEIPFYGQRHVVRPGLTGWAQVCYTYGASVEDSFEKLQYDLYYVKNLSLVFDLFIMFLTIKTVILQKGA